MGKIRKRIHKINAVNSYEAHIAAYPDSFLGVVTRDDNLCVQFKPVTIKAIKGIGELHKDIGGTTNLRVATNGTDIDTLGVRLTYDIAFSVVLDILGSLDKTKRIDDLKILEAEIKRLLTKHK